MTLKNGLERLRDIGRFIKARNVKGRRSKEGGRDVISTEFN